MLSLDALSKKRCFAKKTFTENHNKLVPLVQLSGLEACDNLPDAKDHMAKGEKCFRAFINAHESYIVALEEETLEKDAESVIDTQFHYLNEVESACMAIRKQYNKFLKYTTEAITANNTMNENKACSTGSIRYLCFL